MVTLIDGRAVRGHVPLRERRLPAVEGQPPRQACPVRNQADRTWNGRCLCAPVVKAESFPKECRYVLETLGGVWHYDALARKQTLSPDERRRLVTGTVDDVRPYYREALAAIVPLRTGGGTRLKILEAMAAGVPVISTSFGAEGLPVSPGGNILIADRDEDWAVQLDALSSWSDRWSSLALAGRCLVKSRYDWDAIGTSLYETYCAWTGPAER